MAGTGGFDTKQVSVATTATQIVARRPGRAAVTITSVGGTQAVYLGHDSGVTTSTGAYIPATDGASLTIPTQEAVYGIVGSSTQTVCAVESY